MSTSRLIAINDPTRQGWARREAAAFARDLNFNEHEVGAVSLVATEMATNLLKHARHGRILLRDLQQGSTRGIELVSVDQGPGMLDVAKCMTDGFSTAGSPGTGLGAIQRMSTVFDVYSQPGSGSVFLSQIWSRAGKKATPPLSLSAICLPMIEGEPSGDAWASSSFHNAERILSVDGLGHGPLAALAANEAVRVFRAAAPIPLAELLLEIHAALKPTRGASIALCEIRPAENQVLFAGVGNISGNINDFDASRSMISHNGTVGHEIHNVKEYNYSFPTGAAVILHSDGMMTRWKLSTYPGLIARHPGLIAGVLYRDFRRPNDDFSIIVVKATS